MSVTAGSRLGPYEIVSRLGSGGMGEVFRAKDTRLGRDVAVKVLPERWTSSPEARQRFEREARAVSQLSHPHVCALYDVGREGEIDYLVMECLEGAPLSELLAKGPLPFPQALAYGIEIADALATAHRRGIIHRDLKPGNMMVTRGGIKLLDFGLAKAVGARAAADLATGQTIAEDATREGVLMGTAGYMAPEQLHGHPADPRSDVFALGIVLYEMASGRRAFRSESVAGTVAAILGTEPEPLLSLLPSLPPAFDRLVRLCLIKEPDERWQSARDVELQLRAIAEGNSESAASRTAPARRRRLQEWLAAGIAGATIVALLALLRPVAVPAAPSMVRFFVAPPTGVSFVQGVESVRMAVSPDGKQLAFVGNERAGTLGIANHEGAKAYHIWLRALDDTEARQVPGTEGARSLFWSPDGKSIGFFAGDQLRQIDLGGAGSPLRICDVSAGTGYAGTWGADGSILFASVQGDGVRRVSANGGEVAIVVQPAAGRGEIASWPWYLPDGRSFLYLARLPTAKRVLMLVRPGEDPVVVGPLESRFEYVEPGYLVFVRESTLLAQRFDLAAGRLVGVPQALAPQVPYFLSTSWAGFATSPTGTLAYETSTDSHRLVWFDRTGRSAGAIGTPGNFLTLAISPDGKRLLFDRRQPTLGTYDLWMRDLERGAETRLTTSAETELAGVWIPGDDRIVYSARRTAAPQLVLRNLATGDEETPVQPRGFQQAQDASRDGKLLVFIQRDANGSLDIWKLPLTGDRTAAPYLETPFHEFSVSLSPDGRYLSFLSDESGENAVYASSLARPAARIRLSEDTATTVRWSRTGREIVYLSSDGRMMSVPVRPGATLATDPPRELFRLPAGASWDGFDVSPDGQRILAIVREVDASTQPATVLVGWTPRAP